MSIQKTDTKNPGANLLSFDSPLYLRRMARELRALPDGFYWNGQRWFRAAFTQGVLRIETARTIAHESHCFATCEGVTFSDAYGRTVCASRKAAR